MRKEISSLIQKYNISSGKIVIFFILLLIAVLKLFSKNQLFSVPLDFFLNLYADTLIAISKGFLIGLKHQFTFDFLANQIIGAAQVLKIDLFYFSINQIVSVFIIILITKSPIRMKIIYFLIGFLILTLFNAIRISLHAIYPGTNSVHHWFFNLVLMPRWLIVLLIIIIYWKKFPHLKETIKNKFNFSEENFRNTILKIVLIVILYHIVVIIAFNDYIAINGTLLIHFVLHTSQWVLNLVGYESIVEGRTIFGGDISLYMDDGCLGINLMFLFASFLVLIPGAIKHKIWYIPLGLVIIILLNCLRVILIFINLYEQRSYSIPLEIHDLFTYPVLLITLLMWIIWMNRFIRPQKNKMDTNKV